ncbi:butyrophilin subfamily 2 member A1-like [Epinephelus fuscoguttatus]|uniref:butyrophilin subfamily 2 member A1-like n=1 Tax=Epinephelus fuscoguttatus TaxID=293821 RepID=UPI0020D17780|nr:butyrophilin subfamily 2 member A1-like [Epinephelus fuscoguttatus]
MSGLRVKALELPFLSLCLLAVAGIIPAHGSGDVTVVVKEGSDAVLPCSLSTKESISAKLFDWRKAAQKDGKKKEVFYYDAGIHYNNGRPGQSEQFKGRVFHFPGELKHGNASIIIRNTTVTDSGNYTCDFPRLQPRQTFHIELVVEPILKDRSGENPAATPKPSIRTLNATVGVLLQCEVRSASPEPHLQWQDSAGNKLPAEEPQVSEREGCYYITLNANVTKSDRYHCVVTQEEISHQTHEETFVFIRETVCEDSSCKVAAGWLFGGLVLGAVTVVALQALLVATKSITVNCNRGSRLKENRSSNQRNGSCTDSSEFPLRSPAV